MALRAAAYGDAAEHLQINTAVLGAAHRRLREILEPHAREIYSEIGKRFDHVASTFAALTRTVGPEGPADLVVGLGDKQRAA